MALKLRGSLLDNTFYISLVLKGLDATVEVLGGVFLLLVSPSVLGRIADWLDGTEAVQNAPHVVATHLHVALHHFATSARIFGAVYLLSHGVVKLVLIVALFKQKLWAYPWMMAVLGGFILYQTYRMVERFSIGMLLLTLFDAFIVWLTWLEYQKHHRHRLNPQA